MTTRFLTQFMGGLMSLAGVSDIWNMVPFLSDMAYASGYGSSMQMSIRLTPYKRVVDGSYSAVAVHAEVMVNGVTEKQDTVIPLKEVGGKWYVTLYVSQSLLSQLDE